MNNTEKANGKAIRGQDQKYYNEIVNGIKKIILIFFIWRIFLFLPLLAGVHFLPYRPGYEYTNLWKYTTSFSPVNSPLLYPWANFDGIHYLLIAGDGYSNNGRFFPLYPALIHVVSLTFGQKQAFTAVTFFAAFFISNISFLLALLVFYKLILLDFGEQTAMQSILFLLLFPASFFFGSLYSESLFLLLSLLSFYCARKKDWLKVGIFGFFLSLTRLVGVFIFPALLFEFYRTEKKPSKTIPLFLIPLGFIVYSIFNKLHWHDPLYFLKSQGTLLNGRSVSSVIFLPQTLLRYFRILLKSAHTFEWGLALFELSLFLFVCFLLYWIFKQKIRTSYLIFSLLCFLLPVSSGTFSGLPRYSLILFPIFIALSFLNKKIKIAYVILSTILLFVLLMFFSRGYFIA